MILIQIEENALFADATLDDLPLYQNELMAMNIHHVSNICEDLGT